MIKLHPIKITNIFLIVLFFGIVLGAVNITNNFEETKSQLTLFYATQFDSCTITTVESRKYPGRGNYSVFYTDCTSGYFPILLEKNARTDNYNLFKANLKVIKAANSVDLILTDDSTIHRLRIRKPEDEDDRDLSTRMILIAMAVGIIVNLLVPNRVFEKETR